MGCLYIGQTRLTRDECELKKFVSELCFIWVGKIATRRTKSGTVGRNIGISRKLYQRYRRKKWGFKRKVCKRKCCRH